MAEGTVMKNATGIPETYTVAANDDFNTIADRLGLNPGYLYTLNMVRRADLELYVGDVLNLDPDHIATVGDENGAVSHMPLPDGAPAQD
jgi:LysM repeat protein